MKNIYALVLALVFVSCQKEIKAEETKTTTTTTTTKTQTSESNNPRTIVEQEKNNPETKPEGDLSSKTKKVLRKVGRKSMDATCKFREDKERCEAEKKAHAMAAKEDERDTIRRKHAKEKEKAEELQAKKTTESNNTP